MTYTVEHYINGKMTAGSSQELQDLFNPATGMTIGQVRYANEKEVDQAIAAAKAAFPAWAAMPPSKRAQIFFQYQQLLKKHMDELAQLITREHGKTLNDARGSIQRGIDVVEFACGIPAYLNGKYSENVGANVDSYSLLQPLGVCVGITPFNFPAMIPLWMFPIALMCGNTFVLKPSEKDPSCALRLAELLTEAGAPQGVLNVINGDKKVVDQLLADTDVKAISFVGSTPVAEYIYHTAAAHNKRVQAFGGAKNHAIVMPDADMEQASDAIMGAAYGSAGERCMALSVIVAVGEKTADDLIKGLSIRLEKIRIGIGTDPEVDMGPLISKAHLQRVQAYVEAGIAENAKLVVDGRHFKLPGHEEGYFMSGCLFDHVMPHMRIYKEEIFGPVLSVVRMPDFASALQLINVHPYGNGTAIFTRDGEVARNFATQVQVGMVGINVPIPVPVAYHSFGGWKQSVFGDIPMYGPESIRFFTKQKTVTVRWPSNTLSTTEFVMPTIK